MGFIDSMKEVLSKEKTFTTNGAVSYKTSGKNIVDFNFEIYGMRSKSKEEIADRFSHVWFEDPKVAIKYLFYVSDVRQGLGERHIFRSCFDWLIETRPDVAKAVLNLIPEYSRWDNLSRLAIYNNVKEDVIRIIGNQITEDLANMKNGKSVSLCAKWLQSENASSKETIMIAKTIRNGLEMKPEAYRKCLSDIRKYIGVVETKMSSNKWNEIDYDSVPSKANLIYGNSFLNHDESRRREYLNSLKTGSAKINASVVNPSEIVRRIKCYCDDGEIDMLESMWKALQKHGVKNALVVRDGSGSMSWNTISKTKETPLDVATAMAIYMSESNSGEWKDKFITFSSNPKIVDLSNCRSLKEKVNICYKHNECLNTDITKTMRLILDTAVENDIDQKDMPESIIICSDMQFDGNAFNLNKTLFEMISDEFKENGYHLPKMIFWNIGYNRDTVPMRENKYGLLLVSGYSTNIVKMFTTGNINPYDALLETLNSKRYSPVDDAINGLIL